VVIAGPVPGAVAGERISLWAGIAINLRVIVKVLRIVSGVRCLAGTAYGWDGHQGIDAKGVCDVELTACMVTLVVECSEGVGPKDGLGPSEHHAHGFYVWHPLWFVPYSIPR